jgi:cytochrome c-type biogenesis protein CcmH/NrfF
MGPTCHGLQEQLPKLEAYVAQGLNRDQIRRAFVKEFGNQGVLMAPLDQGFNRLAWLFPYVVGAIGLAGAIVMARRWSQGSGVEPAIAGGVTENSELRARLDDELRDLD